MDIKKLSLMLLAIIAVGCSPKIRSNLANTSFSALESKEEILVLDTNEKVPESSQFVGDLKIGDSGFSTDCGYTKVIDEAKIAARKSGANLVHLTEVKKPNFGSTCYRIKAKLYKNVNTEVLTKLSENNKLENKSRLPSNADYAVVYFYRPKNFAGSLIGYKIRMDDDTVIGRARNGEKFEYKITDFGEHEFWAKTESKSSVILNVGKGQEYFIRCGINIGIAVGKPELYLIENETGISEYEAVEIK
ncbi:DUF2846 domain-containing protein [Gillisia sp. M10.2A]|uniref:DUF2846 domain-containing protein n=1 Tax=Gillisia lutea TaxID=2909668 RepID=A0ABS9EK96_9FLAO|nr:DUF2846 domain-containing protein [Gillisia lutea]MCF4101881.1 DUF2846 domain-containing protein [Gillisia lutea]